MMIPVENNSTKFMKLTRLLRIHKQRSISVPMFLEELKQESSLIFMEQWSMISTPSHVNPVPKKGAIPLKVFIKSRNLTRLTTSIRGRNSYGSPAILQKTNPGSPRPNNEEWFLG